MVCCETALAAFGSAAYSCVVGVVDDISGSEIVVVSICTSAGRFVEFDVSWVCHHVGVVRVASNVL